MDSNTHSTDGWGARAAVRADRLASLAAAAEELAVQDLDRLTDAALAEEVGRLRRLLDGLEGQWLRRVAAVDARGAAGAEQGPEAGATAAWLRGRLRLGAGAASGAVRTARALFQGPLAGTAAALTSGVISPAPARVLADGTHDLPDHVTAEAEPVLVEAAGRLDPPRLRRAVAHLRLVADPDGADQAAEHRRQRRGLWLAPTWEGMVAVDGLLEPEAGQTLLAALEPLARPADAEDTRSGGQRTADALAELARRALEGGQLPQTGGVRPQLLVTVDLDTLLGRPGAVGGEAGWAGPLAPEACRRLACDGALTRVVVTRHHNHHQPGGQHPDSRSVDHDHGSNRSRVVQPTQHSALAVRDGGCVFPGCDRPLAWCEAHHLLHWLNGGPTDLANLAMLCRAHHRAVHEGGWQLARAPDGRFTATPPHRRHRPAASLGRPCRMRAGGSAG